VLGPSPLPTCLTVKAQAWLETTNTQLMNLMTILASGNIQLQFSIITVPAVYIGSLKPQHTPPIIHHHPFNQPAWVAFRPLIIKLTPYVQWAALTRNSSLADFLMKVEFEKWHQNGCNLPPTSKCKPYRMMHSGTKSILINHVTTSHLEGLVHCPPWKILYNTHSHILGDKGQLRAHHGRLFLFRIQYRVENVDLIDPRIEALLELIHIATEHIAGSSFLFQNTCADANFLVPNCDCLHTT
jgi:hypothetical protein